jgi:hypothetical protein
MRRIIRFFGLIAASLVLTASTTAPAVERENFESQIFSSMWRQKSGVSIQTTGGANGTRRYARLGSQGGKLEGKLASSSNSGLSDFYTECFFRLGATTNNLFDLEVFSGGNASASPRSPVAEVRYEAASGWQVSSGDRGAAEWQCLATLGRVMPDAWYRLRFTGRGWGRTTAFYELQLSLPGGNRFVVGATNPVYARGLDSKAKPEPARFFAFSNGQGGNGSLDLDEIGIAEITPYKGQINPGVDTRTLHGKVMCGYQGWFGAPGDGRPEGSWRHWTKQAGPFADGNAKVDLWPDVSELDSDQRFSTGFVLADGRPAEVFSSFEKPTVLRHFQWMREYGVDGVFVQRFANGLRNPAALKQDDTVLAHCREGANLQGRAYAVMYDLTGLPAGHIQDVIEDWRALRQEMVITEDASYLHHRGKPVVAVWGVGFNDGREYSLAECRQLIEFLKSDRDDGGCTIMLGVPAYWRELTRDAVSDPRLLEIVALADIVSPWTVGRYTNPPDAVRYAEQSLKPDLAWCRERGIDYLPVVFPGFSWHNMYEGQSDQIPRLRGQFLWTQFCAAKRANADMVYVAMFDEVDEATAIFKCVNDVPVGRESKFVTFEGLASDYYLKLVGSGTRLIRGEIPLTDKVAEFSDHRP